MFSSVQVEERGRLKVTESDSREGRWVGWGGEGSSRGTDGRGDHMMGQVEVEAAALTSTLVVLIQDVFAAERRLGRRHLLFSYRRERWTKLMGFHNRGAHRLHNESKLLKDA